MADSRKSWQLNEAGMSLVGTLAVVAILGVLATLAVKNLSPDGTGGMLSVHDYRLWFPPLLIEDARKVAGEALA